MPEKKAKITSLASTYIWGNDKFGPFTPSEQTPYLEVPQDMASGLGLPLYEAETPGEEAAPAADVPSDWEQQRAALLKDTADALEREDRLKERVRELEEAATNATSQQLQVPEGAQLLPADARERLIAIDGIGEATADLVLAALTVPSVVASDTEPPVTVSDDSPPVAQIGDTVATQKTGDLPHNVVGAGKLKAIGITTWEGVREATDQALTYAGLEADQITKLRTLSA